MMNMTPSAELIADAAIRLQYDDITSHASLREFANSFDDLLTMTLRDALIATIDLDLHDMIHNCNLDFYTDLANLDLLTDEQFDALSDHLDNTIDCAMIADRLLDKYPAP